ncbi:peroxidase-like isoform X2 [Rhopalosiphum padi]|nr:peroxidase-like isoform X2 [Rhopalosiphum padi]XP_060850507.1 peroxidase-like isoform X2 [Rhopalosiphum padi]XP_060850508.1 peroxidase-like isoform X2 [Rhopalosiphum padi]
MLSINKPTILIFLIVLLKIHAENYVNLIKNVVIDETFYDTCASSVTCDNTSKYRSIDGSCNNLEHPLWGAALTPYVRLGPAYYDDGNYSIRLQHKDGKELPGVRQLQLALFFPRTPESDTPDQRNYHVNQVGQYVTHDITLMSPNFTVSPADCCTVQDQDNIPFVCQAVIKIDEQDPSYSKINKTCLPFRRAMTAAFDFNCPITPQIPVSQQTAFVDASHLYGPTAAKAASLRSNELGKLKTEMIDGQEFGVQVSRNGSTFCTGRSNVTYCFDRGDPRNNQHFGLILYEETFLRFHNIIADLLHEVNPDWTDEILYQEARRIVIALEEIIVYRDYLQILLGKKYCESTGLFLSKDKKTVYDPSIMPQIAVEFTAGCFRVPHNVIPSIYYFLDENNNVSEQFKLNEYMSIPDPLISKSKLEELLRGMSYQPGRCPLASYNLLITSRMFHDWISIIADQDLGSIDIQRGRDVGVFPYIVARQICGFPNISSFDDLVGVLNSADIKLLVDNYDSVEDIDLIVGALLEPLVDGGMVGETVRCILADGFYRIRYGDRFFCDVQDQPGSFSTEQFDVLWSLDLTKLFCATTNINELPSDIFMPNGLSEMYNCKSLNLDFGAWKVNKTC